MDRLTPQQRHYNMTAIQGRDTKPEMVVLKNRAHFFRGKRSEVRGEEIKKLNENQNENENLFVKIKEPKADGGRSQMTK